MEYSQDQIFREAKENFIDGNYKMAESLLAQLMQKPQRNPEIYQILGTIYYDQGKFNKAIKSFQRALELDPTYTDASVGLSIILNDIGRYDEGKKVFKDAQKLLSLKNQRPDPYVDEKIASKHEELADLYFQYKKYNEALEQLLKAQKLSSRRAEITMRLTEVYSAMGNTEKAIKDLKVLVSEYPQFLPARIKIGLLLFNQGLVQEAMDNWENVLLRDPQNPEVLRYMKKAGLQSPSKLSRDL